MIKYKKDYNVLIVQHTSNQIIMNSNVYNHVQTILI